MPLDSLPPKEKIKFDPVVFSLINEAEKSLQQLNGSLSLFPKDHFIITSLLFREAVYSNSIDEYWSFDKSPFKILIEKSQDELAKINSYLNALSLGQKLLRDISSSSYIIKSIHKELCSGINEQQLRAGEFRNKEISMIQNSEDSFRPPIPEEIEQQMIGLQNYVSSDISYPIVVNAALIHAQFEMIHPFDSNNGLIGRILFQLHLLWKKRLSLPVIQISKLLFTKKKEYFEHLLLLEKNKNWELWIKFFLESTIEASKQTLLLIKNIFSLEQTDYKSILEKELVTAPALKLFDMLFEKPTITLPFIIKELDLNKQTANVLISKFKEAKILEETTGMQRNRIFVYKKLLDILEL